MSRPRRPRPERRAPVQRAWARARAVFHLLVAAALFFTQAAQLSHYLTATHTLCEHGELLELDTSEHVKSAPKAAGLERDLPSVESDESSTQASEHEHCDALAIHHLASRFAIPIPEPTLLCVLAPQSVGEARGERPIALLSLAPKSSPPLPSV